MKPVLINKHVVPLVKVLLEDQRHSNLKPHTQGLVKELYDLMGDLLFSALPTKTN